MRVVDGLKSGIPTKVISRLYSAVIITTAALIPVIVLVRVVRNFRYQYFLTWVEGVWLTSALDFVHGVLYRPLFSSLGYGGTRFFPLYFILTGSLSKILCSLETAGLILSGVSGILLLCAIYFLLRRLNVSVLLSFAAVSAACAARTTQESMLATRSDSLAAMLNLWGLMLCVGFKPRRGLLYLGAVLFTLAFASKLTTVYGFAAVILGWILSRRYKEALQLGLATCLGYVLVLCAIYSGSNGRALEIFRACAGGGGSLNHALQAPFQMLIVLLAGDPVVLLFLVPAVALALSSLKNNGNQILLIYFALVLLVTMVIFGSPGTGNNHLLDLQVVSVMVMVLSISRSPAIAEVVTGVLALSLLVACGATARACLGDLDKPSFRVDVQQVLERLPADSRPVLAENPLVVLKSGKTPYLLDPFMFRVLTNARPAFGNDLYEKITHKGFSAIILVRDPQVFTWWYRDIHFGGEFLQDLEANYSLNYTLGGMYVYSPK